jgi:hypothetical protein
MTSREILASQRILKPAVSTVASSVGRTRHYANRDVLVAGSALAVG